uniref:Uncharacterized protein n=1 Tax=Glossina austeni TaxID=7395 RepID=A0A1A9V3B3_GLOAU
MMCEHVKPSVTVGFLRLRLRDINKFTTLLETFSKRYSVEPKDNRFTLFADEFKLDCVVSAADTFSEAQLAVRIFSKQFTSENFEQFKPAENASFIEELSSLLSSSFERFSKQVKEVCCWELLGKGSDISFLSADSLSVLSESLPSSTSLVQDPKSSYHCLPTFPASVEFVEVVTNLPDASDDNLVGDASSLVACELLEILQCEEILEKLRRYCNYLMTWARHSIRVISKLLIDADRFLPKTEHETAFIFPDFSFSSLKSISPMSAGILRSALCMWHTLDEETLETEYASFIKMFSGWLLITALVAIKSNPVWNSQPPMWNSPASMELTAAYVELIPAFVELTAASVEPKAANVELRLACVVLATP